MACGPCSGASQAEVMRADASLPTNGGYLLGTYPGCQDWYTGLNEGKNIYVVGRNTPEERIFTRTQLADASEYAKSIWPTTLENLPSAQVCRAAIVDIYGQ